MIITNVYDFPQAFVNAISIDHEYKPNEYRATSMLKGFKELLLTRRHDNKIMVDVSDMVWSIFGTAVHNLFKEQKETDSELKEERLRTQIGNYILTGQPDLYCYKTQTLTDYKTTSVWKIIHKSYDDWYRQMYIYSFLLSEYNFPVKEARIIPFLKDHSKTTALRDADYPQHPTFPITFPITDKDIEYTKAWLTERFSLIKKYESLPDDEIPVCTEEERWYTGDKYAVTKEGRKSAVRLLDTEEEAKQYIKDKIKESDLKKISIVKRKGVDNKCTGYCYCNKFCNYYKETY